MKTSTTMSKNNLEDSQNFNKSRNAPSKLNTELFSPVLNSPDRLQHIERVNYYTLRNNIKNPIEKGNYTDRLNNFIQRFSQQLTVEKEEKNILNAYKKRFSLEDEDKSNKKCHYKKSDGSNNK